MIGRKLAVLGGTPLFATPLHVGAPNVGDRRRLHERLDDMLDRRWLTNDGPYVGELEQRIAARVGVQQCVAVSSATQGLSLLARALDLRGEVLMPALTFPGTAHALAWVGLRPVFCDVDPMRHTLDPEAVARRATADTCAVLGVHLWGRLCDVEGLGAVARSRGLPLLFDAAHAFGCARAGCPAGGFGDAEVFSFHATKVVNGFEGGAVVTNDTLLAGRLRLLRNFGFRSYDDVVALGTNAKMSEPSAAMVLGGIEALDAVVAHNRLNLEAYAKGLEGLPGVSLAAAAPDESWHAHYVVVEVDGTQAGIERDELGRVLWAENVRARRYFYPGCHHLAPYRDRDPESGRELPVTERLTRRLLQLPTGTAVSSEQAQAVAEIVRTAVKRAPDVREALAALPSEQAWVAHGGR